MEELAWLNGSSVFPALLAAAGHSTEEGLPDSNAVRGFLVSYSHLAGTFHFRPKLAPAVPPASRCLLRCLHAILAPTWKFLYRAWVSGSSAFMEKEVSEFWLSSNANGMLDRLPKHQQYG